jgi:hypothetical protein
MDRFVRIGFYSASLLGQYMNASANHRRAGEPLCSSKPIQQACVSLHPVEQCECHDHIVYDTQAHRSVVIELQARRSAIPVRIDTPSVAETHTRGI